MPRREQKLFELEEARRTLPLVSRVVRDIVEVTEQMKEVYLEIREVAGSGSDRECLDELQERLQEIADGRSEFFEELAALGIEMKDPNKGLVDFPALLNGRVVYLCWKLGEETIEHWHEVTAGFDNREPVEGNFETGTVVATNEV